MSLTSFATEPWSLRIIGPEFFAFPQVPYSVVVVVEEGRGPGDESVRLRVMIEAVPEDLRGLV